jgi:4-hydroxy-tetrahydrodipicolinate reductase
MTKVIVTGIAGKMGSRIADLIRQTQGMHLAGATEAAGSFAVETMLPEGHLVVDDLSKTIERGDVIIDFTDPKASLRHAELAVEHRKAMVVGTTGFSPEEKSRLAQLLAKIPSVFSPNMSIGVNALLKIVAQTAKLLKEGYDIDVVEAHHRQKKDAPSGTAMALAETIAKATDRDLNKVGRYHRHGLIGERPENEIGLQTIRGGDLVGTHTVYFMGTGETLELTHRATSRDNFARGAILAAKWVKDKPAGLYTMADVLA